jgi:hypothetical protein
MIIIQSFAQFDNQYANGALKGTEKYLNFYNFLYSWITLKKYYNSVIMYCNKNAYENYIKFIPYDYVIIKENKYDYKYWNWYKLDVIEQQIEDFIHVDPDVFIFKDIFIKDFNTYDILIQKEIPEIELYPQIKKFVLDNYTFLNEKNIITTYDNKCLSCGIVGMNIKTKEEYIKNIKLIYNGLSNNQIKLDSELEIYRAMITEELTLHLTSIKNNYNVYDITKHNEPDYLHLWGEKKYTDSNINYIKKIIKTDFSNFYYLIEDYEKTIVNKEIFCYNYDNEYYNTIKYNIKE